MGMIALFLIVNLIAFIMLIWLKSDAVVEWGTLFGLSKFLKIKEFRNERLESAMCGSSLNYPDFLKEKYNYNFITKMLACPLCLCTWLSSIACIIISFILLKPLILLLIPTITILSLIIYGIINTLKILL